jgi:PKD repeat protein
MAGSSNWRQRRNTGAWFWAFGDGTTSTAQNPGHRYLNPGWYQVSLAIEDSCGAATHIDSLYIECTPPEAGFAYEFINNTVTFSDTSISNHPYSWLWDFGDSTTSSLQNPVHEYNQPGIYTVCLTIADACGRDMICRETGIILPMKPAYSTSQNEVNNLQVAFQDQTSGASSWLWEFGDGQTSTEKDPVHVYSQYGEYNVCLTTGNTFITETACDILQVKKINLSYNGNSMVFYPNPYPGTGKMYFMVFEDASKAEITITDLAGRMVAKQNFTDVRKNEPVELNINGLKTGTYLINGNFNNFRRIIKLLSQTKNR